MRAVQWESAIYSSLSQPLSRCRTMKHGLVMKRAWLLLVVVILVAAHGFIFYRISSRLTLILAVGLVVLVKHRGLLGGI